MDQQAAKQQIVDRIKQAENILVTVSANPSIDQLAACIGLTLLINKMGKSATAVYSGKTPSVLEFLQPQKTLETNTDSLRDFIISLDKAKADKLRYKVEDQVVRIFITPYKTKLSEKDLVFGEGDFNVDVVVALGVADRNHLDLAITAHGRILHDATVIAVTAGEGKAPDLGQINWQDPSASSLSEMLVSASEAFGTGLIDNQIATAFLTGIVAETDRFSNKKTSPKVMTMSAQLMAAGANQQLVISKLQPPPPPPPPPPPKPKAAPPLPKKTPEPKPQEPPKPKKEEPKKDVGVLNVAHESTEADGDEVEINTQEIHIDKQGNIKAIEGKEGEVKEEGKPEPPTPAMPPPPQPPPPLPKSTPPKPPEQKLPEPPTFGLPVSQQAAPPPMPTAPVDDLPSLPPPPPPPEIKLEAHPPINNQSPPTTKPVPEAPNVTDEVNHHSLLDPLKRFAPTGAPFSADTTLGIGEGGVNVDPVNNASSTTASEFAGSNKTVAPPPTQTTSLDQLLANQNPDAPKTSPAAGLTPDSARQAVESAYASVPFNPAFNPEADMGASPAVEVHQPPEPAQNETPSLNLPGSPTPPSSSSQQSTPPPPPMPPPIAPGSTPPPTPPPML